MATTRDPKGARRGGKSSGGQFTANTSGKTGVAAPGAAPTDFLGTVREGLAAAHKQVEVHEAQLYRHGHAGVTALARQMFPTAATIELVDASDSGGSPYFLAHRILDAAGDELWSVEASYGRSDAIQDLLGEFTPYFDRHIPESERRHTYLGNDVWEVTLG
jgi:hypothetical protein